MGGAISTAQLEWLREQLHAARASTERVIVLTHVPLLPEAATAGALLWNYLDVLEVLQDAGAAVVPLVLAGHYHSGGYMSDPESGTHHVTLQSPLNTSAEEPQAHCTIEAWSDH